MRRRDQHSRGDSRLTEDCLASPSIQRCWKLIGRIIETIIIHPAKLGIGRDVWSSQVPWEGDGLRGEALFAEARCVHEHQESLGCSAKHRPAL